MAQFLRDRRPKPVAMVKPKPKGRGNGKVGKRFGREGQKIKNYYDKRWALKKLRRILKSNGPAAARVWAKANDALGPLHKLACAAAFDDDGNPTNKIGHLAVKAWEL